MAELRVTRFHGMRPSIYKTLQPGESQGAAFADRAVNAHLRDGSLRAMRQDQIVETLTFSAKTISKLPALTCCAGLYALPYCSSIVDAPSAGCCPCDGQVLSFTSECCDDGSKYHMRCDPCAGTCWPLVIAAPTKAPTIGTVTATTNTTCGNTAAPGSSAHKATTPGSTAVDAGRNVRSGHGAEVTNYVTTWVDKFGVESPPSPPSAVLTKYDDQDVTLTGLAQTPPTNAVVQRIYRAVRDYPIGDELSIGAASYQLVTERSIPASRVMTNTYTDTSTLSALTLGTLMTIEDAPPPECMEQVVLLESGYYVGYSCNELLISERHEPWNWPHKYRHRLPDQIVALAVSGDTVFIATAATPYRAKITPHYGDSMDGIPGQERIASFDTRVDIEPYKEAYPCVGRRTMTATPFGAMYATHDGLIGLRVDSASPVQITKNRIGQDRWREWAPMIGVWWNGHYVGLRPHNGQGFILEVPADGRQMEFGDFVEADMGVTMIHAGRDGRLYGVQGNNLVAMFEGNKQRTCNWKSRVFRTSSLAQMGAAKVVGEYGPAMVFKLYVGGKLVFTHNVKDSKPFRLPKVPRSTDFAVELSGITTISELHVGPNIRALATNAQSVANGQGQGETLA